MPPAPVTSTTEQIGPRAESAIFSIREPFLPAPQPSTNIETTTVISSAAAASSAVAGIRSRMRAVTGSR